VTTRGSGGSALARSSRIISFPGLGPEQFKIPADFIQAAGHIVEGAAGFCEEDIKRVRVIGILIEYGFHYSPGVLPVVH
jgi:hypothetical protein